MPCLSKFYNFYEVLASYYKSWRLIAQIDTKLSAVTVTDDFALFKNPF